MQTRLTLRLAALCFSCSLPLFLSCTDEATDDSSLTVNDFPALLHVGDTSDNLTCKKQVRNTVGRMETQENYAAFTFESADSAIIMPYGRSLIALKTGQTRVIAHDKSSRLQTDSLTIEVE